MTSQRPLLIASLLLAACQASSLCAPGEKGCACVEQSCKTGFVCSGGTCIDESRVSLSVDGNSRGCEVLLRETTGKLSRVVFGDDVSGKWLRQGDKVSAAFIAKEDRAIGSVQAAYAGGGEAFEILKSHCYGANGEELAGVTVRR